MKILGHFAIPSTPFYKVKSIQDIDSIPNNGIIWFDADLDYQLGQFCQENKVSYAVKVSNLKDFLIYSSLNATYILVHSDPQKYQNLAKEYLLDSRVLKIINQEEEIEEMALKGIDGVIFQSFLDK